MTKNIYKIENWSNRGFNGHSLFSRTANHNIRAHVSTNYLSGSHDPSRPWMWSVSIDGFGGVNGTARSQTEAVRFAAEQFEMTIEYLEDGNQPVVMS